MAALTIEEALKTSFALQQAGQRAAAEAMCRQILRLQPTHAEALHLLGMIAFATNHAGDRLVPASEAELNLAAGIQHHEAGRFAEAEKLYRAVLDCSPNNPDALHLLGVVEMDTNRLQEALTHLRQALALSPFSAVYNINLAETLRLLGSTAEATSRFQFIVHRRPDIAIAHYRLGLTYHGMGRLSEAIASYRAALALEPASIDTLLNLAAALSATHTFTEALSIYESVLAIQPELADAHWNLALLLLTLGCYERGWKEYEWRWKLDSFPGGLAVDGAKPWRGGSLKEETLLVQAEQGLGDTIQFIRYLPLLSKSTNAMRITLACQPHLVRLIGASLKHFEVIPISRDSFLNGANRCIPLLSLPLALQVYEPLQMGSPYLTACPNLRGKWKQMLTTAPGLRVGVAWSGAGGHRNDLNRSIPAKCIMPLLRVPDISFYSLQIGIPQELKDDLTKEGLVDISTNISDFADTAALIAELDLVISVDTAVAHLAGAMGRPVWTLLPFASDWRWGLEHETTCWYPTMRLFRQKAMEAWEEVLHRVVEALDTIKS